MVKSTYKNLPCKHFFEDFKNIYREEKYVLSLKSFTGQNSGFNSYLKTILESRISGQKSYHLRFSDFTILHGRIIVSISKLTSKVRITVQTS